MRDLDLIAGPHGCQNLVLLGPIAVEEHLDDNGVEVGALRPRLVRRARDRVGPLLGADLPVAVRANGDKLPGARVPARATDMAYGSRPAMGARVGRGRVEARRAAAVAW